MASKRLIAFELVITAYTCSTSSPTFHAPISWSTLSSYICDVNAAHTNTSSNPCMGRRIAPSWKLWGIKLSFDWLALTHQSCKPLASLAWLGRRRKCYYLDSWTMNERNCVMKFIKFQTVKHKNNSSEQVNIQVKFWKFLKITDKPKVMVS